MTDSIRRAMWHLVLFAMLPAAMARAQGDARDWPMYNHDLAGSRFNPGETTIGRENAGQLVEKWRFPARGRIRRSGSSTPRRRWWTATCTSARPPTRPSTSWRPTASSAGPITSRPSPGKPPGSSGGAGGAGHDFGFQSGAEGIMTSALVTGDTVYFGDLGGWFYALDRETGEERWRIDARASDFPGPIRSTCSSPRRSSPTARSSPAAGRSSN